MSNQTHTNSGFHTPVEGRHHSEHGAHEVKGLTLDTADGPVLITRRQLTKAKYRGYVRLIDGTKVKTKAKSIFKDCLGGCSLWAVNIQSGEEKKAKKAAA